MEVSAGKKDHGLKERAEKIFGSFRSLFYGANEILHFRKSDFKGRFHGILKAERRP